MSIPNGYNPTDPRTCADVGIYHASVASIQHQELMTSEKSMVTINAPAMSPVMLWETAVLI